MLDELREGGKRVVAKALVRIETALDDAETVALLDAAHAAPQGFSLGVTGPPGVGKSTLLNALIDTWRKTGQTVAVIAVDPSSARTGGALLGDRTRLTTDPTDHGIFVRSMAARDMLGGVAEETFPAMVLLRALYDVVLVETVGVGQSETSVSKIVDLTMFCAQPGSGDALQYMKAGIMEIPDLIAVTKADMGEIAQRTATDLRGSLGLNSEGVQPQVILCASATGQGITKLVQTISEIADQNCSRLPEMRNETLIRWSDEQITTRFGTFGGEVVHRLCPPTPDRISFRDAFSRKACLTTAFTETFM